MSEKSNTTSHTPGPWHVGVKQAEQIVYDAHGWAVANATVYHGEADHAETRANARRIVACVNACEGIADPSAAPMLLEAARALLASLEWEEKRSGTTYAGYDELRAAIAAAEGKS